MQISLFPKQKIIFDDKARFKVISCGRRFGKSTVAAYVLLVAALGKENGEYWIVSPSYAQSMVMYRMLNQILRKHELEELVDKRRNGAEVYIEFMNGARIYVKSGDHPDSLRGSGLDGVVIDEAAVVKEDVWKEAIRPALADKKGWAMLISTPKGKNWFYKVFLRGLRGEPGWSSVQFPSWDNPLMTKDEITDLKRTLPEDIFRQEIRAMFIEGGGLVFRDFKHICTATARPWEPGHFYVMGVDLAKSQDFTVIAVADFETREMVYLERFNQLDWGYVKARVRAVSEQYGGASVFLDSTGVGDPVCDDLIQLGVPVYGYKLSNPSKTAIVVNLKLMIANAQIRLFDDPDLCEEFDAYTFVLTASGQLSYRSPDGFHDDVVMATCLMAYGINGGIAVAIGDIDTPGDGESEWDAWERAGERFNDQAPDSDGDGRWDDDAPMLLGPGCRARLSQYS